MTLIGYDYLDLVLVVLFLSLGWMVYRLILKGREFQEKWEDLPQDTKMYVRERYRHPLRRMLWNTFRQDMDIVLAGVMILVMVLVLLWIVG